MNTINYMKKAILYTRVSTDEQKEKGNSLAYQEERLRQYCQCNTIKIVKHFQEDFSAKTFERPEFRKLLSFIKSNKDQIDYLIFLKWDRFSRNATDAFNMIRKLSKLNIESVAIEQPIDLNIPENKIMLALYLINPEVENDRRSLNVTSGMRRAMKDGRWVCKAPKGYMNRRDEKNKPIIVPNEEADYIKKAFSEVAKKVKPIDCIRHELNKEGFTCSKNNFYSLIRNPVYCGKIHIKAYARDQEDAMITDGIHEPLISQELFTKVQNILSGRAKKQSHPKIHKANKYFPLRGFLLCQRCGKTLTGSFSKGNGGKYPYYHCSKGCKERIKAEHIEVSFKKLLYQFKFNEGAKEIFKRILIDKINLSNLNKSKRLEKMDSEIEKNSLRLERLKDMYVDGEVSKEEYQQLKQKYETETYRLKFEKAELKNLNKDTIKQLEFCMDVLVTLPEFYERSTVEGKQQIIGSIFTGNLVFKDKKVRTTKINEAVSLISSIDRSYRRHEKVKPGLNTGLSHKVTPVGLEPTTRRLRVCCSAS